MFELVQYVLNKYVKIYVWNIKSFYTILEDDTFLLIGTVLEHDSSTLNYSGKLL